MQDTSATQTNTETAVEATTTLTEQLNQLDSWLPESLQAAWLVLVNYPLVAALVIALAFYILAITLRSLIVRALGKLTGFTTTTLDDDILNLLRKPVFITVLYFGLALAVAVAQLPAGGESLIKILVSIIVASWMSAMIRASSLVLDTLSTTSRFKLIDTRTVPLFDLTTKLLIIMIGSYCLLMIWGINPIGWLASAGIAGLAIGFAAKDTLANLFSGFFIVADAPYKIGDYINLDSGERGKVCAIGLRSTRLLTRDDVEITIPNGVIANAKIINESGGPQNIRIRIVVGVAYGSDVDLVSELLMKAGTEHSEICPDPAPRVRLRGFGASSLDFNLMCWISKPEDRGRIAHELHMTIYKMFNSHGVEIPYAKQDVYIKQWPDAGKPSLN
ncbi:mechanosensitive ion channel family protein [Simiduia curdlanivorans]|uniref:Small-conductance mechanosensitive channel n=1 Tax=Simiduia curdlanivorans TaxID=1492769 RepID=A0ABV8V1V5_9GAMM|nr:mechanosensitive ion channel family protein [Simiduia curdlanivorans]MDN3640065.1 mechanosensitive ion channel family protein [Simiduia curdlanivorans]